MDVYEGATRTYMERLVRLKDELEQALHAARVSRKEQMLASLLVEELYVALANSLEPGETMPACYVTTRRWMGEVVVRFSYEGRRRNLIGAQHFEEVETGDPNSIVLYSNRQLMTYSYRKKRNNVSILVHKSARKSITIILAAILAGVFTGLLLQMAAPVSVCSFLNDNIFTLIYEVFLSLLKMMIAPLILFSIISSISSMSNISTVGKLGAKLMLSYLTTTTIACLLGLALGLALVPLVTPVSLTGDLQMEINTVTPSFRGVILSMVPNNLVTPVAKGDMLQLMFIAIFVGMGIGMMRSSMSLVRELVEQLNALSVKLISILMKMMPVVAFCAMASTVINTDISALGTCLLIVLCTVVGIVVMVAVYMAIVWLVGGLSPLPFLRRLGQVMVVPFTTSSSAASLPNTMNVCGQMGIAKSISSFTLPIGATMNMDGCAFSIPAVACLLSATAGMAIDYQALPELILTTILIITAIPGLPGGFIVLAGMVMEMVGIPMVYLTLVIAANPIIDPILTTNNVTGDMAVTVMLAGRAGDIDKEKYNT
ncbi:MAG: dicarboxylate/amino acid:cation symporter [Bacteroidaceae bacterium]|nr:dicarboxylate/amino acid:cation symporter [Bacteroidaceae bacterium]